MASQIRVAIITGKDDTEKSFLMTTVEEEQHERAFLNREQSDPKGYVSGFRFAWVDPESAYGSLAIGDHIVR